MRLIFQKLHIAALTVEYRMAAFTGDTTTQQNMLEKTVLLNTSIRVQKEQHANKLLFSSII